MSKENLLLKLVANLPPVNEGSFTYFDLAKHYDVTLNFIEAGSHLPAHTHEQTVFNYVMEGEFELSISGSSRVYCAGEWLRIPAGQSHSVTAKVAVTLLELWEK